MSVIDSTKDAGTSEGSSGSSTSTHSPGQQYTPALPAQAYAPRAPGLMYTPSTPQQGYGQNHAALPLLYTQPLSSSQGLPPQGYAQAYGLSPLNLGFSPLSPGALSPSPLTPTPWPPQWPQPPAEPDSPMREGTAQVLLLALQKHRQARDESAQVDQEEDAGPIPPSYNPNWTPQHSDSSGSSPTSGPGSSPVSGPGSPPKRG